MVCLFRNELTINIPEKRMVKITLTSSGQKNDLLRRYSDYTRLIRIITYYIRFIKNLRIKTHAKRLKNQRKIGNFYSQVDANSFKTLKRLLHSERSLYSRIIISKNKPLSKSKLFSLCNFFLFLDKDEIIYIVKWQIAKCTHALSENILQYYL